MTSFPPSKQCGITVGGASAGAGCKPADQYSVFCAEASPIKTVLATLRGGPDKLTYGLDATKAPGEPATVRKASIDLGSGADVFEAVDIYDRKALSKDNLTVKGGKGPDQLAGGWGKDVLDCGSGTDLISYANNGNLGVQVSLDKKANDGRAGEKDNVVDCNELRGTAGNDVIRGDDTKNDVEPGEGSDRVYLYGGNDFVAEADNDKGGNDVLSGGQGADDLSGSNGNDTILGGGGRDKLDGGYGTDVLSGGAGNDVLEGTSKGYNPGLTCGGWGLVCSFGDIAHNVYAGGTGTDKVDLSKGSGGRMIINKKFDPQEWNNIQPSVEIILGGPNSDTFIAGASKVKISAGAGDDLIVGSPKADSIDAGSGNDQVDPRGTGDKLNGGGGSDTIDLHRVTKGLRIDIGLGRVTIARGKKVKFPGFESVIGSKGSDTINGTSAANKIDGYRGNDQIRGFGGADTLTGGSGNDSINAGEGDDNLTDDSGADTLVGGGGNDTVANAGMQPFGGGSNSKNKFFGGTGLDTLDISDRLPGYSASLDNVADDGRGGTRGDTVGSDFEVVLGSNGSDVIVAPAKGTTATRRFVGGPGDDRLIAGGDFTTLEGGPGVDTLTGGARADKLLDDGAGNFDISGGGGLDTLDLSTAGPGAMLLSLDGLANDGIAGTTANLKPDVEDVTTGAGNDKVIGSGAAETIHGGGGNDTLDGGGGNDTLFGGTGGDDLTGGLGVDKLFGETDNDKLRGADGTTGEAIDCGAGADAAAYDAGDNIVSCESLL